MALSIGWFKYNTVYHSGVVPMLLDMGREASYPVSEDLSLTIITLALNPLSPLSREPYLRFTRGLFYRDRREKTEFSTSMCEFWGSKLFP